MGFVRQARLLSKEQTERSFMDINQVYHFLFETMPGIGVLVGAGIIISIIVCLILERKTRKRYKNHAKTEDDWSLFDDDDEEDA